MTGCMSVVGYHTHTTLRLLVLSRLVGNEAGMARLSAKRMSGFGEVCCPHSSWYPTRRRQRLAVEGMAVDRGPLTPKRTLKGRSRGGGETCGKHTAAYGKGVIVHGWKRG